MTKAQAVSKAITLFGENAAVKSGKCSVFGWPRTRGAWVLPPGYRCSCPDHLPQCSAGLKTFTIGRVEMGMFFMVKGLGSTWEKAFADHEAREAKDHERYQELQKTIRAEKASKRKATR